MIFGHIPTMNLYHKLLFLTAKEIYWPKSINSTYDELSIGKIWLWKKFFKKYKNKKNIKNIISNSHFFIVGSVVKFLL